MLKLKKSHLGFQGLCELYVFARVHVHMYMYADAGDGSAFHSGSGPLTLLILNFTSLAMQPVLGISCLHLPQPRM